MQNSVLQSENRPHKVHRKLWVQLALSGVISPRGHAASRKWLPDLLLGCTGEIFAGRREREGGMIRVSARNEVGPVEDVKKAEEAASKDDFCFKVDDAEFCKPPLPATK